MFFNICSSVWMMLTFCWDERFSNWKWIFGQNCFFIVSESKAWHFWDLIFEVLNLNQYLIQWFFRKIGYFVDKLMTFESRLWRFHVYWCLKASNWNRHLDSKCHKFWIEIFVFLKTCYEISNIFTFYKDNRFFGWKQVFGGKLVFCYFWKPWNSCEFWISKSWIEIVVFFLKFFQKLVTFESKLWCFFDFWCHKFWNCDVFQHLL